LPIDIHAAVVTPLIVIIPGRTPSPPPPEHAVVDRPVGLARQPANNRTFL
jgi:hypothetical protein